MPFIPHDLAAFLVEAKRRTYASLDDDATVATPPLVGSKQLAKILAAAFHFTLMLLACAPGGPRICHEQFIRDS